MSAPGRHTPGPWEVSAAKTIDGETMVVGGEGQGFGLIAVVTLPTDAPLIAAAPDLLAALHHIRAIIVEAAATGFNCHDGDWAERLFASQATSYAAVRKAEPVPRRGSPMSAPVRAGGRP